MTAFKAIETHYAGCRFRSRLEARWAVVFDHLGTRWEYEPEGIEVDGVRYLPDFWLPQVHKVGVYAEVKGLATASDMRKVVAAVSAGHCFLILGSVPRGDEWGPYFWFYEPQDHRMAVWTVCLFPKTEPGHLHVVPFGFPRSRPFDSHEEEHFEALASMFNDSARMNSVVHPSETVGPAFDAGRSARFEHGECG